MALEGTIKEFGLADIFQLIGLQKKTGILFLKGSDSTVNISFEDGMVVKADDSQKRHKYQLGRILVSRNKITEAQLGEALEIQKSTVQKLGHVLVGQGVITKEDLRDALAFQMGETIYRVFRWKGGDYKFYQDKVDYDRETISPISSEHILMDGIRMLDEWPMIEKRLPGFETVLRRKTGHPAAFHEEDKSDDIFGGFDGRDGETITKEGMQVLDLVDGYRSLYEVVEYSSLGEFDVCKAVVELINKGLVVGADSKPESRLLDEITQRQDKIRIPGKLEILPYVFAAAALAVILLQVTGIRQAMSPKATKLGDIKAAFALSEAERLDNNILLYFLDSGAYPEKMSDLKKMDYISNNEGIDPWGRYYTPVQKNDGAVASASAGPDGIIGTQDDISGTF